MSTQLSVDQLLSLPPDERTAFVEQNLTSEDNTVSIENLTGWEGLSNGERKLLAPWLL